jgi:transposase
MFYVGLDVHSKLIAVCVLNEVGKVHARIQFRQVDELLAYLKRLPGPFQACFEASCGYGEMYDALTKLSNRVLVAHPGQLRLIYRSKRKNDRCDAQKLAQLLLLEQVPAVHVPRSEVRAWRQLITFRRREVEKRTKVKLQLRALLRNAGIKAPGKTRLWSKEGLAWLAQVTFPQPSQELQRDLLLNELKLLKTQLRRLEAELDRIAEGNAAVQLLQSIPGVGPRTAEAIVAFLDDPKRFRRAKSVAAYLGLVPQQDQSGETNRLGHITREGSGVVRGLLGEASWQAIRRSPTVRTYFERIHRGDQDRKKIAIVATAHYLARVMWAMLRDGSLWKESVTIPQAKTTEAA